MKRIEKVYPIKLINISTKEITLHKLLVIEGRHPDNGNIVWKVKLDFFDRKIEPREEFLLSEAIDGIRAIIEPLSYRMLIKWCEIDAVQSGMLVDMTAGQAFYKYEIVKKIDSGLIRKRKSGYKEVKATPKVATNKLVTSG